MRWSCCGLFSILLTGLLWSFPDPRPTPVPPETPPENLIKAQGFGNQLNSCLRTIQRDYYREVPLADLTEAALQEMFDTARIPAPKDLREIIEAGIANRELPQRLAEIRLLLPFRSDLEFDAGLLVALRGAVRLLDPWSGLVPEENSIWTQRRADDEIMSLGIDLVGEVPLGRMTRKFLGERSGVAVGQLPKFPFRIRAVRPGSPAQKAGLTPGDVITHINGLSVSGDQAFDLYSQLVSIPSEKQKSNIVKLTICRGVAPVREYELNKATYIEERIVGVQRQRTGLWNFWLDEEAKLGYVRVLIMHREIGDQFAEVLEMLQKKGMKGLVLDLRWVQGGTSQAVQEIVGSMVLDGLIGSMQYPHHPEATANELRVSRDALPDRFVLDEMPVIVLVNGQTCGMAELLATALQELRGAIIAGQRTQGKGTIQSAVELDGLKPHQVFRLSRGIIVRANGKPLQREPHHHSRDDWGVKPTLGYHLPISPALNDQLQSLHDLYTLRPGNSREASPLDDPEADPQRYRAMQLLEKMTKN